jgi:hypothetical protein
MVQAPMALHVARLLQPKLSLRSNQGHLLKLAMNKSQLQVVPLQLLNLQKKVEPNPRRPDLNDLHPEPHHLIENLMAKRSDMVQHFLMELFMKIMRRV